MKNVCIGEIFKISKENNGEEKLEKK